MVDNKQGSILEEKGIVWYYLANKNDSQTGIPAVYVNSHRVFANINITGAWLCIWHACLEKRGHIKYTGGHPPATQVKT